MTGSVRFGGAACTARLALALVLVSCGPSSDPATSRDPARALRSASTTPPADEVTTASSTPVVALPSGRVFEGLNLPEGSEIIVESDRGTDFQVPFEAADVIAHVHAQLLPTEPTSPARGVARFNRATPRDQDPATFRLYILVTPNPNGGTRVRVQRIPADDSPESRQHRAEEFARELPTLD
jgi:hypothetical protein